MFFQQFVDLDRLLAIFFMTVNSQILQIIVSKLQDFKPVCVKCFGCLVVLSVSDVFKFSRKKQKANKSKAGLYGSVDTKTRIDGIWHLI